MEKVRFAKKSGETQLILGINDGKIKKYYQTQLRDELKNKLGLKNIFEVPKIKKNCS